MSVKNLQETRFSSSVRENYKYTPLERLIPRVSDFQEIKNVPNPARGGLSLFLREAAFSFNDPLLEGAAQSLRRFQPCVIESTPEFSEQPEVLRCRQALESYVLNFSFPVSFHHLDIQNLESETAALMVIWGEVQSRTRAHLVVDVTSLPGKTFSLVLVMRLQEEAEAEVHLFKSGNGLVRTNFYGLLDGNRSRLELRGVVLSDTGAHHDTHAVIRHLAPQTTSHQKIRILGSHKSNSAFTGKIQVEPQAAGTEAYQSARGLPLSEEANIYTRPFLEIHTDDVRCSHGCTTGQLDEDQMHYLRSRGLSEAKARRLLAEAFLREPFQESSSVALRDFLTSALQTRLESCF
jgi:Fe-S cluster assembly scaffold protein SufB